MPNPFPFVWDNALGDGVGWTGTVPNGVGPGIDNPLRKPYDNIGNAVSLGTGDKVNPINWAGGNKQPQSAPVYVVHETGAQLFLPSGLQGFGGGMYAGSQELADLSTNISPLGNGQYGYSYTATNGTSQPINVDWAALGKPNVTVGNDPGNNSFTYTDPNSAYTPLAKQVDALGNVTGLTYGDYQFGTETLRANLPCPRRSVQAGVRR